MEVEELKKMIHKIVLSPEDAPAIAQDVISALDAMANKTKEDEEKIAELSQKTKDLQDTNIKLYLAQTCKTDSDGEEPDDAEKSIDELENEFLALVTGGK